MRDAPGRGAGGRAPRSLLLQERRLSLRPLTPADPATYGDGGKGAVWAEGYRFLCPQGLPDPLSQLNGEGVEDRGGPITVREARPQTWHTEGLTPGRLLTRSTLGRQAAKKLKMTYLPCQL